MASGYELTNRLIALGGIFTALGYPTDTWDEAFTHIAQDNVPETLAEVAELTDKLVAIKPLIVVEYLIDADQDRTPPPGGSSASDAKDTGQVKKTRAPRAEVVNDAGI